MSAPLVVNTTDGTCWTRRMSTRGGLALYAMAEVPTCPDVVMATYEELAEHGIAGTADALPMPAAPGVRAELADLLGDAKPASDGLLRQLAESVRDRLGHEHPKWEDLYCLNLTSYMGERMGPVLRRVLDAEAYVAALEAQRERRRVRLVALQNDAMDMRVSLSPIGEDRKVPFPLGETLTPAVDWLIARVAELKAAPTTVYRAEHSDSGITLGLYTTAAAARAHCEAVVRREIPGASLDWIEDDEDRVAELVAAFGEDERSTGYVVTALDIDSAYDEEADE